MPNSNDSGNNSLRQNPFTKVFDYFTSEGVQERLDKKFEHKPYHIEYKLLRLTALLTSYLFNGFSALTAAALIFFFVQSLAGTIAAGIVTVGAIVALEMGKRFVNGAFFKNLLQYQTFSGGLLAVVILLTGLSVASSFFGGKQAVKEFSGEAVVVSTDSTTAQVEKQIDAIDKQIDELSKSKNKEGIIYWNAQSSIDKLAAQKAILTAELVRTRERTDSNNDSTETKHEQSVALKGEHFALVTLLCELLFLLCAWYLEYYDWRSFVELRAKAQQDGQTANGTVSNSSATNPILNGHSTPAAAGLGTNNRVVIQGFQTHQRQNSNATVITQPLAENTFTNNCQHCHNDFETLDNSVITCDNCLEKFANEVIEETVTVALAEGEKMCLHCKKPFKYKVAWQKFCSNKGEGNCKDAYHAARHAGRAFAPGLYHSHRS